MAKILIIGDIMGRPGRQALSQVLPMWKQEYSPDVIIGNVENLTHGRGIMPRHIEELNDLGFDAYTSGNHVFDTGPHAQECFEKFHQIVRPQNYIGDYPGTGFYRFAKNGQQYLVLNLSGKLFMEVNGKWNIANPFFALDELIQEQGQKDDIIIVDIHGEATGEKVAMGWHADGRVTFVYGTHTHVPTADGRLLHKGTAYLTDVGVTGAYDSVLGVDVESALGLFLEKHKMKNEIPETGPAIVNALLVETEGNKAIKIERLQKIVNL